MGHRYIITVALNAVCVTSRKVAARSLTGGTARSVQGQDGLDGHVHGGDVKGLKHDLGHLLTVSFGVQRGLGEQGRVLLRGHAELVVEGVVPDLLHVVPVGDDAVLDWVLQGQDTSLALSLVSNVGVFLTHTDHHTLKGNIEYNMIRTAQGKPTQSFSQ